VPACDSEGSARAARSGRPPAAELPRDYWPATLAACHVMLAHLGVRCRRPSAPRGAGDAMGVNQRRPQMQQEFADARPETAAGAISPTEEGRRYLSFDEGGCHSARKLSSVSRIQAGPTPSSHCRTCGSRRKSRSQHCSSVLTRMLRLPTRHGLTAGAPGQARPRKQQMAAWPHAVRRCPQRQQLEPHRLGRRHRHVNRPLQSILPMHLRPLPDARRS